MNKQDRELATIKIDGKHHDVVASHHAMKRMCERKVDKYVIAGNVLALGKERINELQNNNDEAIIIDDVNNVSVVVGFSKDNITIITVIAKSNIFVKSNTQIYTI